MMCGKEMKISWKRCNQSHYFSLFKVLVFLVLITQFTAQSCLTPHVVVLKQPSLNLTEKFWLLKHCSFQMSQKLVLKAFAFISNSRQFRWYKSMLAHACRSSPGRVLGFGEHCDTCSPGAIHPGLPHLLPCPAPLPSCPLPIPVHP